MSHDFPSGSVSIASIPTGGPNTGGLEEGGIAKSSESCKQATTIDMLPDDVFLQIFDFCRMEHDPDVGYPPRPVWDWHRLVHVCQRWRHIVFASPRRLDLQIYCTYRTPVRENLGCWPALPIAIDYCIYHDEGYDDGYETPPPTGEDCDNAIAAFEHPDRVRSIRITMTKFLLEDMVVVLQKPFPVLTSLMLQSGPGPGYIPPFLPDAFLGGYAPRLQEFALDSVPFPTFPTFLRSARDLVKLQLFNIPLDGSISAGMMVASLAELTKLEYLNISIEERWRWFKSSSLSDQIRAPQTRIVLPTLTRFRFLGTRKYLEEFVAQTETPQLSHLSIKYPSIRDVVQVPHTFEFISRTEHLKLAEFRRARVHFGGPDAHISLDHSQAERHPCYLDLRIQCGRLYRQIPTMIRLLTRLESSHIISNVRHLSVATFDEEPLRGNTDPAEWLVFLRSFTAVETLETCDRLAGLLVTVLEVSTDMVAATLPALQSLNLEGQPLTSGALKKFVAARQLSGRPIIVDNIRKNTPCEMCHYHPQQDAKDENAQEDEKSSLQEQPDLSS